MKCEYCGKEQRGFTEIYGHPKMYFAKEFKVSQSTIRKRHVDGTLAGIITAGKLPRKVSDTLYRRKYKLSVTEIADKFGVSQGLISKWHHSGQLEGKLKGKG